MRTLEQIAHELGVALPGRAPGDVHVGEVSAKEVRALARAGIAEELDVVATPSLDNGAVVVDFGGRRFELSVLREAVDPVGLVRCLVGSHGT